MGAGAGGAGGGGGRAARALRCLLLLVMALAAVEYLFGSILDASPLRTYLYSPLYNATQPLYRPKQRSTWSKRLPVNVVPQDKTKEAKPIKTNATAPTVTEAAPSIPSSNTSANVSVHAVNVTNEKPDNTTPLLISKIMESVKNMVTTEESELKKNKSSLPLCAEKPPDLGPVSANKTDMKLEEVDKKYPDVEMGGRYTPPNCTARHRVAIIVPYRDRPEHLAIFLNHMHPFLMKQELEYGIFIVEQEGKSQFNRAKLFNVGFIESQKISDWQCFVFHDVDLLPLDTRNIYSCPRQPRHMSASIDKHNNKLLYEDLFGGVSALTHEQFVKVNGFSNKYWGWGGEDDDMASRLKKKNYHIARYKMSIARYAMLSHKPSPPNPKRYQLLSQTKKNFMKDGLSTLKYEVSKVVQHHLFTLLVVNIDERS